MGYESRIVKQTIQCFKGQKIWTNPLKKYICVCWSYLTLSDPVDCSLLDSSVHEFSRQEYWSRLPLCQLGCGLFLTQNPKQRMLELSMFSSLSLGVIHNVSEKSQESLHLNEYFIFTCLFFFFFCYFWWDLRLKVRVNVSLIHCLT